jgi:hypothetical protein
VVKPVYDTLWSSDLIVGPIQVFISLMQHHIHIFELLAKIIFLASGSGSISKSDRGDDPPRVRRPRQLQVPPVSKERLDLIPKPAVIHSKIGVLVLRVSIGLPEVLNLVSKVLKLSGRFVDGDTLIFKLSQEIIFSFLITSVLISIAVDAPLETSVRSLKGNRLSGTLLVRLS